MKRQVSKLWVRRYEQPRDSAGRFLEGTFIYTRADGGHRFLRHAWDPIEEDLAHTLLNVNRFRWFLQLMVPILVIAIVLFIKGWV